MAKSMSELRWDDRITGKILIMARLINTAPVVIGSGEGDAADVEIVRWPDKDVPFIPASSLAGCLKRFHQKHFDASQHNNHWFWPEGDRDAKRRKPGEEIPLQSHIRFNDLVPEIFPKEKLVVRDGVMINHEKGAAEDRKKYDYQLMEPGVEFPFFAEITIRHGMDINAVKQLAADIQTALCSDELRIGAFTNSGFGRMECKGFKVWHFEFDRDADAWLEYVKTKQIKLPEQNLSGLQRSISSSGFSIEAIFQLKSSLIIGAYSEGEEEGSDKSQLKSGEDFVLPGKSIRGALRHRALKILKTKGDAEQAEDQIQSLFGIVIEDEDKKEQKKGRLRIEEVRLKKDEVQSLIQNRVRIDRFTGGTVDGGLFNSQPIWTTGREHLKVCLTVHQEATTQDKELLLFLLKDLWLEDLPIGGEKSIGRGVLCGMEARILDGGTEIARFSRNAEDDTLIFHTSDAAALERLIQS